MKYLKYASMLYLCLRRSKSHGKLFFFKLTPADRINVITYVISCDNIYYIILPYINL